MSADPSLLSEFGGRLVTLCDGRSGLRGGVLAEVGEPAGLGTATVNSPPVLDFIASSETLDRYDEIISAKGWRLENYSRNPVFQNAHQYGDIIFTLGRALVTEVRTVNSRPVLFQRIEFATDANPMARIAYGLYKGKFLNAVSVGFIPIRWINADGSPNNSELCEGLPPGAEAGRSGDAGAPKFRRKYVEQELLEVSAVGIPANPDALQLGLRAGAIDKSDLKETLEMLAQMECFRSNPADPITHASASGDRSYEAQLLQLARDISQLMKRA